MKQLIKKILNENLNIIYEIDLQGTFKDVSFKQLSIDEAREYLERVISNCEKKPAEREKLAANKPYIHGKAIPKSEGGEIDMDAFIQKITSMPNEILSINSKMAKSADDNSFTVNIGIPALRGLVYDLDAGVFYIVNTCPGAGACALFCYARQGSYVMFPNVFVNQTRILNLLLNFPERFEKLLFRELESVALKNPNMSIKMRWNDAGDFFSEEYFNIAFRITKKLKADGYNVTSYAYSKMANVANLEDDDFIVNVSGDINVKQSKQIKDIESKKTQVTVPKDLFDDLLLKDKRQYAVNEKGKVIFKNGQDGIDALKKRISLKYDVPVETLLTYDEMMKTPKGEKNQYNVVIMPRGDGDIAAQRMDVKTSFLLIH
jgi:hypothetical protein